MTKFQIIKQRCADRSFYGIAARIVERHGCTVKKPKPNNDIRNGLRNRMPINESHFEIDD